MTKKASNAKQGGLREWISQNASKYDIGDREGFFRACAKERNVSLRRVKDCVAFMRREGELPVNAFVVAKVEDNTEVKIEEGLKELGSFIIKDDDFRFELSISRDKWKTTSRLPEFFQNRCEIKGKKFRGFYWGSETVIANLKKKIELI